MQSALGTYIIEEQHSVIRFVVFECVDYQLYESSKIVRYELTILKQGK